MVEKKEPIIDWSGRDVYNSEGNLIHEGRRYMIHEPNIIEITGCNDCPFCHITDAPGGELLSCAAKNNDTIAELSGGEKMKQDTPEWCPIKQNGHVHVIKKPIFKLDL